MGSQPVGTTGESRLISSVENTRVHIVWNKDTTGKKGHTDKSLPRTNLMGLIGTWLTKPAALWGVGTHSPAFDLTSQRRQLRLLGALTLPRLYL